MKTKTSSQKKKSTTFDFSVEKRSVYSLLIFLVILGFTFLNFCYYLIPGFKELFSLDTKALTLNNIKEIYLPIISYALISLNVIFFVRIFKKLKNPNNQRVGLINLFFKGLVIGGVVGLIFGFIGLIVGLIISKVFAGVFFGLMLGLTAGLIIGLIIGLVFGLLEELTSKKQIE